jgi:hypothetical protein
MYTGAPHFYRILENIHVPSRYVGTETLLNAETFNDVPAYLAATEPIGAELTGLADARYNFQPPFNTVSRERDPGQVNLNTVTGRRFVDPSTGVPRIWSDVYDGIMHRHRDGNTSSQFGHLGPAWRDVVLSRKGYAQYNADDPSWDQPIEKPADLAPPDVFQFGLNYGFPTVFANPFRSPDAGSLVPIVQMMQHGVDASWLRVHPRTRNNGKDDDDDSEIDELDEVHDRYWGDDNVDDDGNGLVDDAREAGLHLDGVSHRGPPSSGQFRGVPEDQLQGDRDRERVPLFSEETISPFADGDRNPYMMYQPMSRLGNLVTNRSNVYAIWITVGYFEVEPAPNWNDSDDDRREAIRRRFGATDGWDDNNDPTTVAALALYNRVYPDGYMLGREVGSDTGDVKRPRGFYIVDRSEEVGFKPGEDLNVEKTIRLRRRIE